MTMNKGKRNIRICLMCMVFLAVAAGVIYYCYTLQKQNSEMQGTLITHVMTGPAALWKK